VSTEDIRAGLASYPTGTVAMFQFYYNFTNWLDYFNNILPQEKQIDSDKTIGCGPLSFFDNLGGLLAKTPKRVLANYVMWRHALESVDFLPNSFRNLQKTCTEAITGRIDEVPRLWQCFTVTYSKTFSVAVNSLYVRKYFNKNDKQKVLQIVTNVKKAFEEMLKKNTWIDIKTKTNALQKLHKMTEVIGHADEYLNNSKIEEYYATWPAEIDEKKFFESTLKIRFAIKEKESKLLDSPVVRDDWTEKAEPAVVNAYYKWLFNRILLDAGILQGDFFNASLPQYMNYGGIGMVIGHEITHGFDNKGSQYDGNGTLIDWWDPATKDAFREKMQCIIDQYSNFVEPLTKLNLNGNLTLGENIADIGGVRQAYRAYVQWSKENPKEPKLPGLDFTPQQMFWIANGQLSCSVYQEQTLRNNIAYDEHSLKRFRVNGPFSDLKEFADDFKCSSGTKMNPPNKCEVW
jgi:neprilysin